MLNSWTVPNTDQYINIDILKNPSNIKITINITSSLFKKSPICTSLRVSSKDNYFNQQIHVLKLI